MAYFSKFYNGLRPIIFFCNHLERAKRYWNNRRLLERAKRNWNARKALLRSLYCLLAGDIISVLLSPGTRAGQAAGLLPRGRLLPISIIDAYERSYEGEGLAIGGQYGWVDDATRWHKECETYQRQPKQGGDDGYHQLHPRAVVSFHRRLSLKPNEHVF